MALQRLPCLVDCISGDHVVVEKVPFTVGGAESSNWRIVEDGMPDEVFSLAWKNSGYWLCPAPGVPVLLDGRAIHTESPVSLGNDHSLTAGGQFFLLRLTSAPSDWLNHIRPQEWYVHDLTTSHSSGPFPWFGLGEQIRLAADPTQTLVHCGGMIIGFFASQVLSAKAAVASGPPSSVTSQSSGSQPTPPPEDAEINAEHGEFTCPVCWLKFDRGDVMNVAVHASLRGDPMLGEAAMQRFFATRYNDRGQALDALNLPTTDLACPHCRRKLPPGFLDTTHHIFSIVGAPSSGKSYYLSVLVKLLQQNLFQKFNVTFRDADPSENVILTQMKTSLFSAGTPQEAYLAKTDLEGALYETLPRYGRKVKLPRPFTFRLSSADDASREASIVFYDNAGEHFEPTRNSSDSPGAQHIAVASGIFFLFDPLHSAEFRARLNGVMDPQMAIQRMDQQDVILAESEVRIKTILGLDAKQRVLTPLAFMVGKCDTWVKTLDSDALLPCSVDGRVQLGNLKANSARLREFMMEIAPQVVANAEAISSNVMYFAVSPLGASPVEFLDRDGSMKIGPDPKKLNPINVDAPTLWVLSQLMPDLIPSTED